MATPSPVHTTPSSRKARGAFFTPDPLARFLTDWAISSPADRVLEPACGEAAFLLAATRRLATLGTAVHDQTPAQVAGIELHPASAQMARELLQAEGASASIQVSDFFAIEPTGSYDAIIGNPPYVRYQDFSGEARARSRQAALRAGIPLTNLTA